MEKPIRKPACQWCSTPSFRGYSLADIRNLSEPGQPWNGLGASYRNHDSHRPDGHLSADVRRALDYTSTLAEKANRAAHRKYYSHSGRSSGGPAGRWLAYALAWADHGVSRKSPTVDGEDVFQSLAIKAAVAGEVKTGTPVVGVGGRSLSLSPAFFRPPPCSRSFGGRGKWSAPHRAGKGRRSAEADFYTLTGTPTGSRRCRRRRVIVADVHPAWSVLGRQHRAMYDLIAHAGMTDRPTSTPPPG